MKVVTPMRSLLHWEAFLWHNGGLSYSVEFTLYFMHGNGYGVIHKVKPPIYWSRKSQISFFMQSDVIESSIEMLDNHMERLGISLDK